MKKALRDANTARALAVVRFGHRPPARYTPTDRTDYNTLRRYVSYFTSAQNRTEQNRTRAILR